MARTGRPSPSPCGAVVVALLAAACASEAKDTATATHYSPTDGGPLSEQDARAEHTNGTGGARSTNGQAPDASLSSGGFITDGGPHRPFLDSDAGPEPPSYCVAPCLWEAARHCIPQLDECTEEALSGGLATALCDNGTGWVKVSAYAGFGNGHNAVGRDGALCIRAAARIGFEMTAYSTTGGAIGLTFNNTFYCGEVSVNDLKPENFVDGGLHLASGGITKAYAMDRTAPECARWDSMGMPSRSTCRTTVSGTCVGAAGLAR